MIRHEGCSNAHGLRWSFWLAILTMAMAATTTEEPKKNNEQSDQEKATKHASDSSAHYSFIDTSPPQ